jgi:transposase
MNIFLQELSKCYSDDYIVLVVDGAGWHKSKGLVLPANIEIISLPPYTPEMNPIEQVWAWLRLHGFHNEVFTSLSLVVDRLCDTIATLSPQTVSSITYRDWMLPTS